MKESVISVKQGFQNASGSVHAGSFLKAMASQNPNDAVYELCPKCSTYFANKESYEYPQPLTTRNKTMISFNDYLELDAFIEEEIQKEAKNVYGNELDPPDVARMKIQIQKIRRGQKIPHTDFEKEVAANQSLPEPVRNVANIYTGVKHLVKQAVAQWKKTPEEKAAEKEAADKEAYKQRVITALKAKSAPRRRV